MSRSQLIQRSMLVILALSALSHAEEIALDESRPSVDAILWPELDAGYLSLYLDNDLFGGTDEQYTNGARLAWMSRARKVDDLTNIYRLLEDFSEFTKVRGKSVPWIYNFGFSLTHLMFTPEDISVPSLIQKDRPYAGWLGFGFSLHAKNDEEQHSIELSVGVVGDESLAEDAQDFVHDLRDFDKAQGWNNQLRTEPTINIHYRRTRRHFEFSTVGDQLEFDSFYRWGFDLGNAWTNAQTGYWLRFGYNLPTEFSDPTLSSTSYTHQLFAEREERINPWSLFLVLGVEGKAVARDIFLDGNTFTDSHSVDTRPLVGELTAAVGLRHNKATLTYAHTLRTKEFDDQKEEHVFGSLSLGLSF